MLPATTLWLELVDELPECRCNCVHCACVSYLVIQGQVTESWDVLGPLHQDQELLLHGLAHVSDGRDLFSPDVPVEYGSRGGDLAETAVCWRTTPHFYLGSMLGVVVILPVLRGHQPG